jgi:PRTRC genetic system protein A
MTPIIAYCIAQTVDLGPIQASSYEYVLAGNGVFLRAARTGLAITLPLAICEVRNLCPLEPRLELECGGPIPAHLLSRILDLARQAAAEEPREALFHLSYAEDRWQLEVPLQIQTECSVEPLDSGPESSYARALIEIHSHHQMPARFSSIDDTEERGFRIFGVIGCIWKRPEIRFRVGVFGQFIEVPARWVCEMPAEIRDCAEEI